MNRRWKPSKAKAKAFSQTMSSIDAFCTEHDITQSSTSDSYYFTLNGRDYRVSNHSIEASNTRAFDPITGEKRRELYHENGRENGTTYIHASKTRIIDIYNDLAAGHKLDGRGNRIM